MRNLNKYYLFSLLYVLSGLFYFFGLTQFLDNILFRNANKPEEFIDYPYYFHSARTFIIIIYPILYGICAILIYYFLRNKVFVGSKIIKAVLLVFSLLWLLYLPFFLAVANGGLFVF